MVDDDLDDYIDDDGDGDHYNDMIPDVAVNDDYDYNRHSRRHNR